MKGKDAVNWENGRRGGSATGGGPPTLTDVARRAGVSKATASVVLNGATSGTRVSDATRSRVEEAAAALRYHPNAAARALARRRTNTLGVLFGRITGSVMTNPYVNATLQGVFAAAKREDFDVHIFTGDWEGAARSAARYRDSRTDGLIVVSPFTDSDMIEGLVALGVPLSVVCWDPAVADVPCVDVDNALGVRLAVEHLVTLGHKRIAHVAGDANYASGAARRAAFLAEMARASLPVPPEYVQPGTFRGGETCAQSVHRLLDLPQPPTALVAGNDAIARAALDAAAHRGLRVPRDLSVVGFNDFEFAGSAEPALTSVREPMVEIGEVAVRQLLGALDPDAGAAPPRRVWVAPTLTVRDTTAPLSAD